MKMIALCMSLLALVACDIDADGNGLWNDRSTSPTVEAPVDQLEAAPIDYANLVPARPLPPPPVAGCADGFERIDYEPPYVLFCQKRPGAPWVADPCLGLRVVATNGDLVACE